MAYYSNAECSCGHLLGMCVCFHSPINSPLFNPRDTLTTAKEVPVNDDSYVPVGEGTSVEKPINILDGEELSSNEAEDETEGLQQQVSQQEVPKKGGPNVNIGSDGTIHRSDSTGKKNEATLYNLFNPAFSGEYDISNGTLTQQDTQVAQCNNVVTQQDVQAFDQFLLNPSSNMGLQQSFVGMGFGAQFDGITNMNMKNIQGGIGQCDFSQERADLNNAMSLPSNFGNFDNFDNFNNFNNFNNGLGFMQPINTTAQDPAQSMLFNDDGFDGLNPAFPASQFPMPGTNITDATYTSFSQPQNQALFSGLSNGNAPVQHSASQGYPSTLFLDKPQMRNLPQGQETANAWPQKEKPIKDQTSAQASIRTTGEAGQDLFGVDRQDQSPLQGPSSQAPSVLLTPPSTKKLSANQLGKRPVPQPSLDLVSSDATPSKKRPRLADIQIPSEPSKRARIGAPVPPPFAAEVESDQARGRPVKVLLKTSWEKMTQMEKARILLPMIMGKHPVEFEKEEMQRGFSFGAMRQREALQKTMRLRDEAVAEAQVAVAARTPKSVAPAEEMDEDDEIAALKARLAEVEANKKAKANEEKKRIANEKRAATMRRKRQEKKDADRAQREKEAEEFARREAEREANRERYFAEEQRRLAEAELRRAEEERRLAEERSMRENPFAHLGFAAAKPYGA